MVGIEPTSSHVIGLATLPLSHRDLTLGMAHSSTNDYISSQLRHHKPQIKNKLEKKICIPKKNFNLNANKS